LEFAVEKHETGLQHYACQVGDLVLELYPRMQERLGRTAYGATALGFVVDNLAALLENVEKEYIYAPQTQHPYGRTAFLHDPDGRKVILQEKEKKKE
jgi:hypothetical protein